ncbi:MAG TPA: thioredoxin domain-containing protein [Longimicrobiales bacterium]
MKRIVSPVVSLAAAAALLAAPAAAQQTEHRDLLERAGESRAKGSPEAPVLVYEIADFQCPYCARFAQDVFPRIDSAYIRPGRVQWVFVNLPMPSHRVAWAASEAALCAGAVSDRFWAMHDRLFAEPRDWTTANDPAAVIIRYAREADVAMDEFTECIARDLVAPLILQDVIFGSRVTGTPTFIVDNQQTVVGVKSFEEWREVLEAALRRKD